MQPSLSELQAWFLTVMTAPGGAERGLELAQNYSGFSERALVRPAAGPRSRLHIYADGYVLRLLECLRADFPVLRKVMGGALFDFFAKAYVWRHPSRSPTLYDLGGGFADFLQQSQPSGKGAEAALLEFPLDLARLERARTESMRAPGLENRPAHAGDAMDLLLGQDMQLQLAPCTRLLELAFPMHAFWELADAGEPPPAPPPQPTLLAVGRLRYRVSTHALQPWQYHYLKAAQPGASAQRCALIAAEKSGLQVERILADALLWQPTAVAAGLLVTGTV
ncbi:HvfC/BufC family peptide modification chaperone [Sorangium sp. So ce1151]|uniref:HvfC/BufC family peptide modification chaperone n=1 Tax=Sorangium sp. So ce1151 TaxID=3133332 RepID=UPI003F5EC269